MPRVFSSFLRIVVKLLLLQQCTKLFFFFISFCFFSGCYSGYAAWWCDEAVVTRPKSKLCTASPPLLEGFVFCLIWGQLHSAVHKNICYKMQPLVGLCKRSKCCRKCSSHELILNRVPPTSTSIGNIYIKKYEYTKWKLAASRGLPVVLCAWHSAWHATGLWQKKTLFNCVWRTLCSLQRTIFSVCLLCSLPTSFNFKKTLLDTRRERELKWKPCTDGWALHIN